MQAAAVLAFSVAVMTMDEVTTSGVECEADHQCDRGYCYLETGNCVSCTDCSIYFRKPPMWRSCARGAHDCGACVNGFQIEILADGSTRDYCVKKALGSDKKYTPSSTYIGPVIGLVLGVIAIVVALACLNIYRGVKNRTSQGHVSSPEDPPPPPSPPPGRDHDNPPPSYDSSVPLLRVDGVSTPRVNSIIVTEKEDDNLQQAVPFTEPHPPYGRGGYAVDTPGFEDNIHLDQPEPYNDTFQESNDEDEHHHGVSPPQLEDEDTMPSDWVPGSCNPPSPRAEEEQEAISSISTSCTSSNMSSFSNINNQDESVGRNSGRALNDSGVSASCSHQSDLSCVEDVSSLEMLPVQGGADGSMRFILERHRSDEDIGTLSELHDNKRQRRDSGSASMKSLEPF